MTYTIDSLKRRIWGLVVSKTYGKAIYPYLYRSYWHSLFYKVSSNVNGNNYITARPNPGAGIGHQMAGWNSGCWWAKYFGLRHAHIGFSKASWESLLGLQGEDPTLETLKCGGYKLRTLPKFDEYKPEEMDLIRKIIGSYSKEKIVFICELDQPYLEQIGVIDELRDRFFSAPSRIHDKLLYDDKNYNIAIHVRRGDIMSDCSNPNLVMRILSNDYFEKVLTQVAEHYKSLTEKPVHIYVFSQGNREDYPEFNKFDNLHWCLDMGTQDSFLHFIYADCLITSKSSFSYKPALINKKGIKICPREFWHHYPDTTDWIMVENDGSVNWK